MRFKQYRLWTRDRSTWCDYDIVGEKSHAAAIQRLMPTGWDGCGHEVTRDFELIPEIDNPHDDHAISVRADGRTVGYLKREDAPMWAGVVRRIVASGLTPITAGRVYAWTATNWEDLDRNGDPKDELAAKVQLRLGKPHTALPLNDPPAAPYTLIPRSAIVQVTKETDYSRSLLGLVPAVGYGLVFVTLRDKIVTRGGSAKSVVETCINGECVGQLTPQMSQRFLPMIEHLERRGLVTACWGDITGSSVAAEVRIDGVKANEADAAVLDGDSVTVPRLIGALDDPLAYDLSPGPACSMNHDPKRRTVQTASPSTVQTPDGAGRHRRGVALPPSAPLPPASWYEDPTDQKLLRYWNGATWTHHTAPNPR